MKISEIVGEAKLSGRKLDAAVAAEVFGCTAPAGVSLETIACAFSERLEAAHDVLEEMRRRWRTADSEELYWQITDCQEYGWRVDVMWSHHDGDVPVQECERDQELPVAICRAALRWVTEQKGGG